MGRLEAAAAAAAAVLLLSGCGETRVPDEGERKVRIANRPHEEMSALPPDLQRLTLMRAIRDSGMRCQRVEAGRYQEEYRGLAMWVALCNDGRHWAVFVAPTGDLQVRNCADADQLRLPQCRPVAGPGGG